MDSQELRINLQAIIQRMDIIIQQNQQLLQVFKEEAEEEEHTHRS